MKVTVVLPIYNGAATLAKTLESLSRQTFQDFELLACIDGTRDASKDIIKSFENHFNKLRILENKANRGLGPTMNRLVAEAIGDYIAIAEQDDFYYPDRLQQQVDVLNKYDEVGMVSGIAEFSNDIKATKFPGILVQGKQYPQGKEMFLLNYKNQLKVVNSCMMFRKSVHIQNGLYFSQHFPSVSVDWAYVLRFSLISKIYGLHTILVRIDRSDTRNSVTSDKTKQFLAARELIKNMYFEYPNLISHNIYRKALNTQRLLEISQNYGFKFYLKAIGHSIYKYDDPRFFRLFLKRLKMKQAKRI